MIIMHMLYYIGTMVCSRQMEYYGLKMLNAFGTPNELDVKVGSYFITIEIMETVLCVMMTTFTQIYF